MASGGWSRGRSADASGALLIVGAACGAVGAIAGLVVRLLVPGPVAGVLGDVAMLLGAIVAVSATVAAVARHELRRQASFISTTAERWLVEVLPPARVLHLLLNRIYGKPEANQAVITSLLGGEGRLVDGSDLTISEHTEIDHRLIRLDEHSYRLVMRVEYEFRSRVAGDSVVIFATSDPVLRDSIVSACRLPLFELLFVRDDSETLPFADAVDLVKESVRIGMRYVDDTGCHHDVETVDPGEKLEDTKVSEWSRYLSLFGAEAGARGPRPAEYMDRLRIFRLKLDDLTTDMPKVARVECLTVESSSTQRVSDGFCYWQAPYPCFVESMRFDVTPFALDHEDFWFHLKPFTIGTASVPAGWGRREPVVLRVGHWVLGGHGVALGWHRVPAAPAPRRSGEGRPADSATRAAARDLDDPTRAAAGQLDDPARAATGNVDDPARPATRNGDRGRDAGVERHVDP